MASTIVTHFELRPPNFLIPPKTSHNHTSFVEVLPSKMSPRKLNAQYFGWHPMVCICNSFSVLVRACSDGGQGEIFAAQQPSSVSFDVDTVRDSPSSAGDGHVALFVRMLGIDNDPQDREQAIVALWKYSLGGKQYVDNIMKYGGTLNLIVNLLRSDSDSAREAAAGLLRVLSSINVYRDLVGACGAIEEITSLLMRSSLSSNVKEQSICMLWNLSVDERFGVKIITSELFLLLVRFIEDEDLNVKEAAGGVLANLTLSQSNHTIMVEAGVIPKLAKFLKADAEESKVLRKVAKDALLKLAKDDYHRILIVNEGLVLVPLIGSEAYKSFTPALYSWPSLPDGTKIEQISKGPSRYGASELLLGLSIDQKTIDLEDAKMNAVVGRTQQQFLARIGAIEIEDDEKSSQKFTLLPWMDGVARLVLILGLEDESAVSRAADSIADASINEHMRVSFREAGAVKLLVQLIDHNRDDVKVAALRALDRLSISNYVCQTIEADGALHPLINLVKQSNISHSFTGLILNILARILDPNREMMAKTIATVDLADAVLLSYLVNILKTSNADLQRKAASIMEFIAVNEPNCLENFIAADIESGFKAVFQQKSLIEEEEGKERELQILEEEEAGGAVCAASRLLTIFLDHNHFRQTIHFTNLLRGILKSNIPLSNKHWVAACLTSLSSENQIKLEITLHETIPKLIENSGDSCEAALLGISRLISEGSLDCSGVVCSQGGLSPLVKLMEIGNDKVVEACLGILYNISLNSENHPAILAAGAVPVLRKTVLSQKPQWTTAIRLLRALPSY